MEFDYSDNIYDIIRAVLEYFDDVREHAYRLGNYTDNVEGMLKDEVGVGAIEGIRELSNALKLCADDGEYEIKRILHKMQEREEDREEYEELDNEKTVEKEADEEESNNEEE